MSDYLSENGLLYEFQSGFRSSYSTDTCLIHLTDYIKLENDTGNFTGIYIYKFISDKQVHMYT